MLTRAMCEKVVRVERTQWYLECDLEWDYMVRNERRHARAGGGRFRTDSWMLFRRSGDITRTQNVSEYMLVLALCLVHDSRDAKAVIFFPAVFVGMGVRTLSELPPRQRLQEKNHCLRIPTIKVVRRCPDGEFLAIFCVLHFQRAACSTFQTCILNLH